MLTALIGGEDMAKTVQLLLEYNPAPPFQAGSPLTAESHILQRAEAVSQPMFDKRVGTIQQMAEEGLNSAIAKG